MKPPPGRGTIFTDVHKILVFTHNAVLDYANSCPKIYIHIEYVYSKQISYKLFMSIGKQKRKICFSLDKGKPSIRVIRMFGTQLNSQNVSLNA